jgi:hypothetical protein
MAATEAKTMDIKEISEKSSSETHTFITDGTHEARIEELVEILEDEEDIREGLKALADKEGTITWEQYQRQRAEQESQGGLSG